MDDSLANFSYRALELLCRRQARISATPETRDALAMMALEYKQLADLQDRESREAKESGS